MPISAVFGKAYTALMLAKFFEAGLIRRIVDVGAGAGTYHSLLSPVAPGVHWIAVEAWTPNIDRFGLDALYDEVVAGDVRDVDFAPLAPDLVLFGDVLEHMTRDDACEVVKRAVEAAPHVMISIPLIPWPQDEIDGNPFERHVKDDWSHQEVRDSFPGVAACLIHGPIGVYFLSRRPEAAGRLARVHDVVAPLMIRRFGRDILLAERA